MTLFAFSTENWKRPKREINFLFSLLETFLVKRINEFNSQKIKLKVIGRKNFTVKINKLLNKCEKFTSTNKRLQINLALNYGSKKEIIDAFEKLNNKKKN